MLKSSLRCVKNYSLSELVRKIASKGILAADETADVMQDRFDKIGVLNVLRNREAYRRFLFQIPSLEDYVSGIIMCEETLLNDELRNIVLDRNISVGLTVDEGYKEYGGQFEVAGKENLHQKLALGKEKDCVFVKWRTPIRMSAEHSENSFPTERSLEKNLNDILYYADAALSNGLIPIVEPEVLVLEDNFQLKRCKNITERVYKSLFEVLRKGSIPLDSIILKPNMVVNQGCLSSNDSSQSVGFATNQVFKKCVPEEVQAIMFLSGGMTEQQAVQNLNEINKQSDRRMTYSFGRSLQDSAREAFFTEGEEEAQKRFTQQARNCYYASNGFFDQSKVICCGHVCLDYIPNMEDFESDLVFEGGVLKNIKELNVSTGGSVSNTGIGLSKLDCEVEFIACVGDDQIGETTLSILSEYGSTEHSQCVEGNSSYSIVLSPQNQDRFILHYPGCNDEFSMEMLPFNSLSKFEEGTLFHFGYPPLLKQFTQNDGKEMMKVFKKMKLLGFRTSLDMSYPDINSESGNIDWKRWYSNVLPYVDIFLPSIEEAYFTLRPNTFLKKKQQAEEQGISVIENIKLSDYKKLSQEYVDIGAKVVVIKAGKYGCYMNVSREAKTVVNWSKEDVKKHGNEFLMPGYVIEEDKVVNALGAGDVFVSGFLSSVSKNKPLRDCARFANAAGYCNLLGIDAVSGVMNFHDTEALIKELIEIENMRCY